jgi:hypothetical protein
MLPLCGFYAAAIAQVLHLFSLRADARVNECRASGTRKGCHLLIDVRQGSSPAETPAAA